MVLPNRLDSEPGELEGTKKLFPFTLPSACTEEESEATEVEEDSLAQAG